MELSFAADNKETIKIKQQGLLNNSTKSLMILNYWNNTGIIDKLIVLDKNKELNISNMEIFNHTYMKVVFKNDDKLSVLLDIN